MVVGGHIVLADVNDIPEGKSLEIAAAGRIFAVYNVKGEFHVIDGICPHAGGPLGKGMLRGNIVTCPWHGWQFNVATGKHCLNDRICQETFACRVVDGKICVDAD